MPRLIYRRPLAPGIPAALGRPGHSRTGRQDITGGESALLTYDRRGLPDSVLAARPELTGYLALRVDARVRQQLPGIASGDVAVGGYAGGRLVDAGLVDTTAVD